MALFENYERRIDKINGVLAQYGLNSVEECREICQAKGHYGQWDAAVKYIDPRHE